MIHREWWRCRCGRRVEMGTDQFGTAKCKCGAVLAIPFRGLM